MDELPTHYLKTIFGITCVTKYMSSRMGIVTSFCAIVQEFYTYNRATTVLRYHFVKHTKEGALSKILKHLYPFIDLS